MIDFAKYTKFHSPGYVVEVYNNGECREIIFGNRMVKPRARACNRDTLYDIASLTKVYTAVLVYMAYEEGKIEIDDFVGDIDERFAHLQNVKVIDLLSHNQDIWTDGYLGDAKSRDDFYKILFSAYVKNNSPVYADVHYIILSTMLEKIYGKAFTEILDEKILRKLKLTQTTVNPAGNNIASNSVTASDAELGLINDAKGRVAKSFGITTGHASIFTTGAELLEFLKSFLDDTLLKPETIKLMLERRKTKSGAPRRFNNMGVRCWKKNDVLHGTSVGCSNSMITFSGYTGPAFVIDFERKVIIVVMCNVLYGTKLSRSERKHYTDVILESLYNEIVG